MASRRRVAPIASVPPWRRHVLSTPNTCRDVARRRPAATCQELPSARWLAENSLRPFGALPYQHQHRQCRRRSPACYSSAPTLGPRGRWASGGVSEDATKTPQGAVGREAAATTILAARDAKHAAEEREWRGRQESNPLRHGFGDRRSTGELHPRIGTDVTSSNVNHPVHSRALCH